MKIPDADWKMLVMRSLAQGTILAACVVGAMHVAHAWEGRSGVEARSFFTVSGTLAGVPASPTPTLRFTFHKAGETAPCPPIDAVMVAYNGTTFSAQVPYEACGRGYFDGANITVDVSINGTSVAMGQSVNPVPYAHFASVAGQYGTPDCPMGYERRVDVAQGFPENGIKRLCVRRTRDGVTILDEVVRVGDKGPSVFWIDRYEDSVSTSFEVAPPEAVILGRSSDDYGDALRDNGTWMTGRYALSMRAPSGTPPSRYLTWFQANTACRLAGKRLPTGDEWLMAAQGTLQSSAECNIDHPGTGARNPGGGTSCVSAWGAQDMVGNLQEFTSEWFAGVGSPTPTIATNRWPTEYGGSTYNIASGARSADPMRTAGLPAVALRGGEWNGGGIFELNLAESPANAGQTAGFRCVIPR